MSTVRTPFSAAEQERFHALLKLAAESPFQGERDNALAAADRLAAQHGMSLEEAAAPPDPEPEPRQEPRYQPFYARSRTATAAEVADAINLMDTNLRADKARREAALEEAYARGLDAEERGSTHRNETPIYRFRKGARRNPQAHAHVLLSETTLPLAEIVSLTGLDIYEVVGMKLKLRRAGAA